MKLKNGLFTVFNGEEVTITITPSGSLGAGQVVPSRDGGVQPPLDFVVTKNVSQEHSVRIFFGFEGASSGSIYRIAIDGDAEDNEGPFNRRVTTSQERIFTFHVVNNSTN